MRFTPKFKRNIFRIIPFGILWCIIFGGLILNDLTLNRNQSIDTEVDILLTPEAIIFSFVLSVFVGLLVGYFEVVVLEKRFRRYSFGVTVLFKLGLYLCIFILIISLFYPIAAVIESGRPISDPNIWRRFGNFLGSLSFWNTLFQLGFALLLSVFYSAVSENLGYKLLRNLIFGNYHRPIVEERIFMFLDMKDSTQIAELLGHKNYFKFLSDYYDAMSDAIIQHKGEVYQYIGDEVVITWKADEGLENANCLGTYFGIGYALDAKRNHFLKTYGKVPGFKAGFHLGEVTTGEMGTLKREIVFTGDVLNTAARIQGKCKFYEKDCLISGDLFNRLPNVKDFQTKQEGEEVLRGKEGSTEIFSVEKL